MGMYAVRVWEEEWCPSPSHRHRERVTQDSMERETFPLITLGLRPYYKRNNRRLISILISRREHLDDNAPSEELDFCPICSHHRSVAEREQRA